MPLVERYKWIRKARKLPTWMYSKPRTAAGLRTYEICAAEEKKFSRAFKDAIKELENDPEIKRQFMAAWASGNAEWAFRALPIGGNVSGEEPTWGRFFARLKTAYTDTVRLAGIEGVRRLQHVVGDIVRIDTVRKAKKKPDLREILVVPVSPASLKWVDTRALELVTEGISNAGRERVRGYIYDAMEKGQRVEDTYEKVRGSIGLTDAQFEAVKRRRELLEDQGYQSKEIKELEREYKDQLLDSRAETIARTETFQAISQGRNDVWQQAQDSGDLPEVERVWITPPPTPSPNAPCEACLAMEGKTAPVGGYYESDDWGQTKMPPGHPRCGCDETLQRVGAED
ncbi:MAG: hypothetical protein PHE55_08815 [Methylococcaceae bacterium]|nr:hypothetical protein [Methylococcaceae bacterium]